MKPWLWLISVWFFFSGAGRYIILVSFISSPCPVFPFGLSWQIKLPSLKTMNVVALLKLAMGLLDEARLQRWAVFSQFIGEALISKQKKSYGSIFSEYRFFPLPILRDSLGLKPVRQFITVIMWNMEFTVVVPYCTAALTSLLLRPLSLACNWVSDRPNKYQGKQIRKKKRLLLQGREAEFCREIKSGWRARYIGYR